MRGLCVLTVLCSACSNDFLPASYVAGLRVLGLRAEPPELLPGQTARLTPLAVDTRGGAVTLDWATCLLASPPSASATVNRDCLDTPPALTPLGAGDTMAVTMPDVSPSQLGLPDATLGLYLPVRVIASAPPEPAVTTFYRLRLTIDTPLVHPKPNSNPRFLGISYVTKAGEVRPLDPNAPITLRAGQSITLQAPFSDDSVETYYVLDPDNPDVPKTQREQLRVSWYATAGSFSEDVTGQARPNTDFRLDTRLPSGDTIDVWAVGIDERGGSDWAHVTFGYSKP
jgi:hypothetical protein